jgi:hypothetical protein
VRSILQPPVFELTALLELLKAKIIDPEEKVRAAACKVYSQIDYEAALHHVSVDELRAVVERGMDKKVLVFPVMYELHLC